MEEKIDKFIRWGDDAFNKRKYKLAKKHYFSALEENPKDYSALVGFGITCFKLGDVDTSINFLETARQIYPTDTIILNNLGWAYSGRGEKFKGLRHLVSAFERNSDNLEIKVHLGHSCLDAGEEVLLEVLKERYGKIPEEYSKFFDSLKELRDKITKGK